MVSRTRLTSMMSIPMETITGETDVKRNDAALQDAGFYWRERDGVQALVCKPLEHDGFANAFSTRVGGVSPMPDNSLNLAGFNEDAAENIYENRRRFLKLFPGEWTLTGCWQMHGAEVRVVLTAAEAQPTPGVLGETQYCDVLVSNVPRVLVGVKTADCVPILVGDPISGAFAAVHAGWRGTVVSVVRRAIEQMQEQYGAKPWNLRAAIGPAANLCCYEVGAEVIEQFTDQFPHSQMLFAATRDGHARIDLQTANREQLVSAGLTPDRIHVAPLCTMERTDLFFSYRREKAVHGRVGRLMSVIGRP
jgi:polyphenol oxidase